jgi:hypothetical protein
MDAALDCVRTWPRLGIEMKIDFRQCQCGHDFTMHDPSYNNEGRDPCFFCGCRDFKDWVDLAPFDVNAPLDWDFINQHPTYLHSYQSQVLKFAKMWEVHDIYDVSGMD